MPERLFWPEEDFDCTSHRAPDAPSRLSMIN